MNPDHHDDLLKRHKKTMPPKLAQKILLTFLRDDLAEEVIGDLQEKFYQSLKSKSLLRAKLDYWLQALHYARPFAIKKRQPLQLISSAMYKSYFKFGCRNLVKNKTYSLINIGGLAIGLACCIAIALYILDEYSYDRFHSRHKDIYRVATQQTMGGEVFNIASTPGPLGSALKSDFPEVEEYCRIGKVKSAGVLQSGGSVAEPEELLLVDNNFFKVFDFELIQGNSRTALLSPDEVVISQSMALKLFGKDWKSAPDLVGRQIEYNDNRVLTLSGIAYDPPTNSHIQFDVLLSLRYEEINSEYYGWNSNNYNTYVLLNSDSDAKALNVKLHKHLDKYVANESDVTLWLQALSEIYLYSDFAFQTDFSKTGSVLYVQIFLAVGSMVLLIALSNFVNLSTARATKRAKEVGVRKVVGAVHKQLVSQFLSEALIMTSVSISVALILVQLLLPFVNEVASKSIRIPFTDPYFLFGVVGFVLLVTLLGGIYPAFYLSNFRPVKVLKGFSSGNKAILFRRGLVVSQFTFCVSLIIGTIVIYQQLVFLQQKNLGFDKSQLLYVSLKNNLPANVQVIKNDLQNQTGISGVTATSNNLIDVVRSTGGIEWEGKAPDDKILMTHMNVDYDFLSTTGMTIVAGRNIDPAIASDTLSAYLISETAARQMGWSVSEAVGKKLAMWEHEGQIIGVVKDFHFRPMTSTIEPFLFRYWPSEVPSGLLVKTMANRTADAIAAIERIYKKHDAKSTLHYQFVQDGLDNQYRLEQNTARIVMAFSALAIIVSCLGLFGLATYTAEQRIREIGVRKVLGASVTSIVTLLSRDFVALVGIAILIASPLALWGMARWLQNFAYKIDLELWMFITAGGVATSIALITVSFQSFRAALMNPVKNLRSE
jgi:putative ABC transport system permease protein